MLVIENLALLAIVGLSTPATATALTLWLEAIATAVWVGGTVAAVLWVHNRGLRVR